MSYQVKIISALNRLGLNGTANPDGTHNSGRLLGEAFLWDEVVRYAEARSKKAWQALETEGHITRPDEPGEYSLVVSPSFAVTAKVSNPVRRFNVNALAKVLKQKYKVPEPVTVELCEQAKVPTKSSVTYTVAERS